MANTLYALSLESIVKKDHISAECKTLGLKDTLN